MDPRTKKRLITALQENESVDTRINGHKYTLRYQPEYDAVTATPIGKGDTASSAIGWGDYAYTHGGKVFRRAVEWCRELFGELTKKIA